MRWQVRIFTLILFLFIFENVSAVEFGASPSKMKITAYSNEEYCNHIRVFSSLERVDVIVRVNLDKEIFETKYDKEFTLLKENNFRFCLKPSKDGKYEKTIEFEFVNYNAIIGVILEINVLPSDSLLKVTGDSVFSGFSGKNVNSLMIQSMFLLILLVIFLSMLFRLKNR